ncbi:hypothetical protein ASPFODRAFT_701879 [Aspergillus luchuensis CBS 106.47]|uniref:Uncharacterized protein n=1 Tax=Aspergillus luchuensis (strain CBS 106.47) TaxID=1137211 RepID=A0A1M3T4W1_ASPLC|nr:hypothetical protein ASPFODRAFT_701879 [Aspergillus luchuensis CBS 106.47]
MTGGALTTSSSGRMAMANGPGAEQSTPPGLGDRGAFLDHSLDALVLPAIGGTGPLSIATKEKGVVVSSSSWFGDDFQRPGMTCL